MRNKLYYSRLLSVIFIAIIAISLLSACRSERERTTIEVYHPTTQERIVEYKTYELEYDGEPKIFSVKVKSNNTDKYLNDTNFKNGNWKSHIKLWMRTDSQSAYLDKGIISWETDWPIEKGEYDMLLEFNHHGPLDSVENDINYYSSSFRFFIRIV